MKLHGSLEDNLAAAVRSARKLRSHPVYGDTLRYWEELLGHARRATALPPRDRQNVDRLITELESEMSARSS